MGLHLFNSMTRQKELFEPINPDEVTMYTCGPTVYNYAHIGNFRAYIFEDLLHRALLFKGYNVKQIMNLTDIDDKTIRGSLENNLSLNDYTKKYKEAFFEDIKALNITPCALYPAATEHIDEMVEMVETLLKKGFAYEKEGSIYFKIDSFSKYGKLAHLDKEGMEAGRSGRVDADEYDKENVSDFVLWKKHTEKDGDIFWETSLGKGRPGWHIECSAMSMKYLGQEMDIHTGGIDNMFPHHENEIAQSEAYSGSNFVRYWLHCAYLIVNGEKMSKSKNNFFTFRDLIGKGFSARAIRLLLLSTHYRKMLNFTEQGLKGMETALHKLDVFIQELLCPDTAANSSRPEVETAITTMSKNFEAAIEDDLNISEAQAALFSFIKETRELLPFSSEEANKTIEAFKKADIVLGVLNFEKQTIASDIEEMIAARNQARKDRNFAEADRIRDELLAQGITLKDTPQGTVWEKNS